ncbi:hypothetical protein [Nonomuraea sp. NPDC050310]
MSEERVDAVVRGLDRVAELPVGEHVRVFEEAYAALEEALASVDA